MTTILKTPRCGNCIHGRELNGPMGSLTCCVNPKHVYVSDRNCCAQFKAYEGDRHPYHSYGS